MTKRVYKYKFGNEADTINIKAAGIALVAQQGDDLYPTVWAEHASEGEQVFDLMIFGTGKNIPFGFEHIGSAICGPFVWHVYRMEQLDAEPR